MAVHYLGDNGPDGMCLGTSSTEKVGFFGATPVVKQTDTALVQLSSTYTTSEGFTSAGADAALDAINAILTALSNYGLASS